MESLKVDFFSAKAYPNSYKNDSQIISGRDLGKIENETFGVTNSFEINRIPICSLLRENKATYKIPIYQRGYEWTNGNIETLIDDIEKRIKDNQEHYLGVIAGRMQKANT
jgi:uncharacterized protein with ParB-like and HNH nuclease domain